MKPFYATKLALLIAIFLGFNWAANAQTYTYPYSGGVQSFIVPAGITEVSIDMQGAEGGSDYDGSSYGSPGYGGRVQCLMAVTPGQLLNVYVGQAGPNGTCYCTTSNAFNGGGEGGGYGGAGGGGTDIRTGGVAVANRVVCAGGGGGCGMYCSPSSGGNGGGLTGGNGVTCICANYRGGGGTQTAGGAGGYAPSGTFGAGGNYGCCYAGGGGGGWYGGGGSDEEGGGGGGSSYTSPTLVSSGSVIHTQGYNSAGNGVCYINIPPPGGTITPSCLAFGSEVVGSTSAPQTVVLNFYNLSPASGTLTASIPSGFQASLDGVTWATGTMSIPYSGGGSTATIYVEFIPTVYSTISSNICISGGSIIGSQCFCVGGNGVFPCSGAPTGVTSSITPTIGNSATSFTVSLAGVPTGGVTYVWESSPYPTFGFMPISGATTTASYTFTGLAATTYYEAVLTCPYSGLSANSTISEATDTTYTSLTHCLGAPTVGTILADVTSACSTFTSDMGYYSSTSSTTSGLIYQWQTSTDGVSWSPVSGATNLYYTTTVSSGPVYYNMMVTCTNSGLSNTSPSETLNLLPVPAPITGASLVCMPAPTAMSSATSGGTWSSSNTTVAAVTLSSGVVTGATNGTSIISYTLGDGCTSTMPVTVGPGAVAITGSSAVCQGSSTSAFYDGSGGGRWSSSNTAIASIGTGTGIANGVSAGSVNIIYTLPSGCTATSPFVVNSNPAAISGTAHVCVGSTVTLTDATSGGTWVSSNFNAVAGLISGVISGETIGASTITYTSSVGCIATLPIAVNSLPDAITATSTAVCAGATLPLTETSFGGTWSSTNTSVAMVDPVSGIVTGVAAGSPSIVYTLGGTGCSTAIGIMVDPLPSVNTVTETNGGFYCAGGSGVHIGLDGSATGINYDLWSSGSDLTGPVPGSSSALDFGLFTIPGAYTVVATDGITGCQSNMTGSANVVMNMLPNIYNVAGGGTYCTGSSGADVNMSGSDLGVSYQLYNSSIAVGSLVSGTGGYLDFGDEAAIGTYSVSAVNSSTGCVNYMNGSATVNSPTTLNVYPVTGGGNYCSGATTGADVQLGGSDIGVTYTLMNGSAVIATVTSALGGAIDFGSQLAGNYTVVASLLPCTQNMSGSATVGTLPVPAVFTLTGGGNYCAGTSGTHIGLSSSTTGINYTLYNSTGFVSTVGGSFSGLDFGLVTTMDTYFAVAVNPTTGCSDTMIGTTTVGVNPLPNVYSVSTGGSFCAGSTGVDVNLSGSDNAVNYQLYNGTTGEGIPMAGTTGILDWGFITSPGTYTIMATNPATTCTALMSGSSVITINELPVPYNVTGGGNYCSGGAGSVISLNNTQAGVTYNVIYAGGGPVGSVVGTGSAMSLGSYMGTGSYTVQGVIGTCMSDMNGSVNIGTNPLPASYPVTGGGIYCSGGTGEHVGLGTTNTGINYQLLVSGATSGLPVAGTGFTYDFGTKTVAGVYQVVATNATTGCTDTMAGSVTVGVNAAPSLYTVINGGPYCAGGTGSNVSLSNSDYTVNYSLYDGSGLIGSSYGSGSVLSFGNQTAPGVYTVVGFDSSTGCSLNMSGSATIVVEPLPAAYSVGGGGNYCAGSSAGVAVSVSGSTSGIQYILYLTGAPVYSVTGTSGAVSFPSVFTAGTYTVEAVNLGTGCSNTMTGSANVTIIPTVTPAVVVSTGMGDTVCGGPVTFTAMTTNGGTTPTYGWTVNGSPMGTSAGTYTYTPASGDVVAVTMTSNAECPFPATASNLQTITVTGPQVPSMAITTPNADICAGTMVNLSTSSVVNGGSAPSYSWIVDGIAEGSGTTFSYTPANHDVVFAVLASNAPCRTLNTVNSNNVVFNVLSPITPAFTIAADPGVDINKGNQVTFTVNLLNSFDSGSYAWYINGNTTPVSTSAYYTTANLHNNDTVKCTVTSLTPLTCGDVSTTSEVIMSVSSLGVNNQVGSSNNIVVVPNPNNGSFTVKGALGVTTDQEVTLQVTNMIGQVVYNGQVFAKAGVINSQVQLNGNLANGMYILNIHTAGGNSVFHFVVEQ